jgi:hypothetical protein
LLTSLLLGVALPARSDDSLATLSVGARVRLSAPSISARPLVGTLVRLQCDVLDVAREDGVVASIPATSIAKLEVSSGKKRSTLLGLFSGAALGVALTLITIRCEKPGFCEDTAGYRTLGLVVFGGGGAAVGALVGTAIRTERWTTVRISASQGVAAPGGLTLSFALSF